MDFNIRFEGKSFNLNSTYQNNGSELILLLHGLGCTKESFEDIWNNEAFEKYSILSVDLVGFGLSSKPQDFSYALQDQALIIKILLDTIKFEKLHIIAHSMGGAIGILLTDLLTNRLKKFINIEGNLISEDCGLMSRKTISVSFEEFKQHVFDEIKDMFRHSPETGSQLWVNWCNQSDPLAFYKSAQSLVTISESNKLLEKFIQLNAKKYYVYASANDQMPILDRLENIEKIKISNSGHFVMNDNPTEFYKKLSSILM